MQTLTLNNFTEAHDALVKLAAHGQDKIGAEDRRALLVVAAVLVLTEAVDYLSERIELYSGRE